MTYATKEQTRVKVEEVKKLISQGMKAGEARKKVGISHSTYHGYLERERIQKAGGDAPSDVEVKVTRAYIKKPRKESKVQTFDTKIDSKVIMFVGSAKDILNLTQEIKGLL